MFFNSSMSVNLNLNFLVGGLLATLLVDLDFLHQNFGPTVGTCECLSLYCECRWGGDSTWRW